jgi:pyrimidine-nucleoside phosphorylase
VASCRTLNSTLPSSMHVPALISRKRSGGALTEAEIDGLVRGLCDGTVPDYQWSALAMAIFFRGMSAEETWSLTRAMRDSGEVLAWGSPGTRPPVVDKHSTGGIGDKTSLVLAPLLAADGLWVPMISGRGLGITGGTLDKLESIPGFRVGLTREEMERQLPAIGCFMAGQTGNLCPADRRLYALRDVTGTVPSVPLITASIMSKKLAEGLDRLVLDVKFGSGAFMNSRAEAEALAASLVAAGELGGVRITALLNPMEEPLGRAVGNALEVRECLDLMHGEGPPDTEALILDLAAAVSDTPRATHAARLRDGTVWRKFVELVSWQTPEMPDLREIGRSIHTAPVIVELPAPASGVLTRADAAAVGETVLLLGAGRARTDDTINPAVGIDELLKTGCTITAGSPLCRIHAASHDDADRAAASLLGRAFTIVS